MQWLSILKNYDVCKFQPVQYKAMPVVESLCYHNYVIVQKSVVYVKNQFRSNEIGVER